MSRPDSPAIFGFTLLRNGVKYDYPFRECLVSLGQVAEKIVLALGHGEDTTEQVLADIPNLHIVPTVWDDKLRSGGLILSQQTNVALDSLRQLAALDKPRWPHAWGIYLQCDEVLHQDDIMILRQDIERADREGADAIAFRYLHFWQEHDALAINKKWYPHEVRAIKLDSSIESWGDAQGFRHHKKVYYSEVRIFHYGHVREADKYLKKKADILKLYHEDQKLAKYKRREKRFDEQTRTLIYKADHPMVMKDRIESFGGKWRPEMCDHVVIIAEQKLFSESTIKRIWSRKTEFITAANEHAIPKGAIVVDFADESLVPIRMESKLARPWSADFRLGLLLSQAGVGLA